MDNPEAPPIRTMCYDVMLIPEKQIDRILESQINQLVKDRFSLAPILVPVRFGTSNCLLARFILAEAYEEDIKTMIDEMKLLRIIKGSLISKCPINLL
jgi:hypothetical protein